MSELADQLTKMPHEVTKASVKGEWELAYSDVELFRSSPFFLAIERALDTSPGIPTLGKWLGITDPTKKSAQFFKLHQLQVLSWGASTVGRISQDIDFEKGEFESAFDTIIFGLTTIPLLGWDFLKQTTTPPTPVPARMIIERHRIDLPTVLLSSSPPCPSQAAPFSP